MSHAGASSRLYERYPVWPLFVIHSATQAGSVLSFVGLAVLLFTQEGSGAVAYSMAAQTIPPLLLATLLVRLVPRRHSSTGIVVGHITRGALLVWLAFNLTIAGVFVYLVMASAIRTYTLPATHSLISIWISGDAARAVRTQLAGLTAAAMAVAPALGGAIIPLAGVAALLVVEAALLFVAAVMLLIYRPQSGGSEAERSGKNQDGDSRPVDSWLLPRPLSASEISWLGLVVVGASLNATEFAVFEIRRFSSVEIGLAMAGWGVGAALTFILASTITTRGVGGKVLATALLGSLIIFTGGPSAVIVVLALAFAGFAHSCLAGLIQARIQVESAGAADDRLIWASLHRWTSAINLAFAAAAGIVLTKRPEYTHTLVWVTPLFAGALVVLLRFSLASETAVTASQKRDVSSS